MRPVIAAIFLAFPLLAQTLITGGNWTYPNADGFTTISINPLPDGATTAFHAITTAATPSTPYSTQASRVLPAAFDKGRWLRFRLWARSDTSNRIGLVHELNSGTYSKSLSYTIRLSTEWKEFAIAYQTDAYAVNASALRIQTGFDAGSVDLASIRLEDFGTSTIPPLNINFDAFGGQSTDDTWREAAQQRIETYRKGPLHISVVDADGNPIPGAAIHVEQQRHAFKFGTAIADGPLFANTADGDKYRQTILRLFNYAVLENALKWDFNNGNFSTADRMLTWASNNNLPVRGHNLFWPSYQYLPASVRSLRGTALRAAIEAHIKDYSTRTVSRVVLWDVINEAYTNTEVTAEVGHDLLWQAYIWAHEINPDIDLVYNDYDLSNVRGGASDAHRNGTLAIIKEMLAKGAPVTMLGDQGHMNPPFTPIPRVMEVWDQMSQFNLPIEITEFDVTLGGIRDEAVQSKYFDDFLTAAFSHPNIRSFLMWGFWDGSHWLAVQGAGMYRLDWSPRPMAAIYEQRVLNDWWTRADLTSVDDGTADVRAFLGTHLITVTIGDQTYTAQVTVDKNQDQQNAVTVTVPSPSSPTLRSRVKLLF